VTHLSKSYDIMVENHRYISIEHLRITGAIPPYSFMAWFYVQGYLNITKYLHRSPFLTANSINLWAIHNSRTTDSIHLVWSVINTQKATWMKYFWLNHVNPATADSSLWRHWDRWSLPLRFDDSTWQCQTELWNRVFYSLSSPTPYKSDWSLDRTNEHQLHVISHEAQSYLSRASEDVGVRNCHIPLLEMCFMRPKDNPLRI
jgi:hypothetical protein